MNSNRLAKESSPYLLQHAQNPVDWYPWSEEAFEKAKQEDKPIFLSIGYSTCHWCHVMEKESFEDEEVAKLMNDVFISIKVDREERPDIDNIYMTVCQIMTGGGGWPLSIVMTPDKKPFFSGTYFPKQSRYGRIGFIDLIKSIDKAWKEKRDEIFESADKITNYLSESQFSNEAEISTKVLTEAYNHFNSRFDKKYGGFGTSPKFPSPNNLMFLLRHWKSSGDEHALNMVTKTLSCMRLGGIWDHVGFGFHRYSTDEKWLVPHFEKMLYDQAMLAIAYLEAYQATGDDFFADTAEEIFEYVLRDMTSNEGAFYSAEDADSEGVEGKFYVWTLDEIQNVLGDEAQLFIDWFNVEVEGNFEEESKRERNGMNIPHLDAPLLELAKQNNMSEDELKNKIDGMRSVLFEVRKRRVHPLKDDKVLTDWNGLMIAALAIGGRVFDRNEYKIAAGKTWEFIEQNLMDGNRLLHRYRNGNAGLTAILDDYAFCIWALLELYSSTNEVKYLSRAIELQQVQDEYYWDDKNFGYYFTASDGEKLITRTKDIYDGAIPSGNSVSLLNLIILSKLTFNEDYQVKVDNMLKGFSSQINRVAAGTTMSLNGINYLLNDYYEFVIVGKSCEDVEPYKKLINEYYIPNKIVHIILPANRQQLIGVNSFLKNFEMIDDETTFYICSKYQCENPITKLEELKKKLTTLK